ncbi:PhnD/SsuA/transferrin family substrate-binding protein [Rhodoplanes sp. SY1]|uniref:substrate-binding domain-containing protein n=1 Tax=Rhodoplanes sp. SY1 TaxID=3166646 RepID=UPI0038B64C5E
MRRFLISLVFAMLCVAPARADPPIRFGLTAAVVREHLDLYDRLAAYLGRKVGRTVQIVQRRSYREAMELIENGEHDFAWICSLPYAKYRDSRRFGLLAVPVFRGEPLYRSYLIVHRSSPVQTMAELEKRVFAYSDPDSNTGYAVPRRQIHELGRNPDSFFRHTFFTYGHTEQIEAVAARLADGAAVDSYVWEFLARHGSPLTNDTRIVAQSEAYGFPPLVYRVGVDPALRERMATALLTMDSDPDGRRLLAELMLDRFTTPDPALYDGVGRNIDRR